MTLSEITAKHAKPNKIELLKAERSYRDALKELGRYAKEGYESIAKEDMDYFLKCFGIFDRPATPGRFMLRVRIPGGALNSVQAKVIGRIAHDYGQDYIDLTTRMQVQLRYLRIEDLPTVLGELEDAGITTYQTGVDNFRNILSDPLDRHAHDNVIDAYPIIEQMQALFLKSDAWIAALPRKFNAAISGSMTNRCNLFAHDCCFALAEKEGEYGFNVHLGGKVGVLAEAADVFLLPDEVPGFFEALMKLFRDFGFRDSRVKNRLHFLIKEAGMATVMAELQTIAGRSYASAGETLVSLPRTDESSGRIRLKDGTFALQMVVPSGIFSGTALIEAAQVADEFGNSELRLTTTQNLYLLGLKHESIAAALTRKSFERYPNLSTPYFNHMVACAGNEHCPFGVIPNKPDAIEMAEFLGHAVPLEPNDKVRMHWSGCVKGCGVHEIADIGFEGCKAKVNGETVYGVHILLGGKATLLNQNGYSVMRAVPLQRARFYVEQLMLAYKEHKKSAESFEQFESRVLSGFSPAAIEFVLRWNADVAPKLPLNALLPLSALMHACRVEQQEIFGFGARLLALLCDVHDYRDAKAYEPKDPQRIAHPSAINPAIPQAIGDIIQKMAAPSHERYEVFSEIIKEIESY